MREARLTLQISCGYTLLRPVNAALQLEGQQRKERMLLLRDVTAPHIGKPDATTPIRDGRRSIVSHRTYARACLGNGSSKGLLSGGAVLLEEETSVAMSHISSEVDNLTVLFELRSQSEASHIVRVIHDALKQGCVPHSCVVAR